MILLCGAHHRAQHRGQLTIEGCVSTGLSFRHADGSHYGASASPRLAALYEEAFRGLRWLGFREGDIRMVLDRLRSDDSVATAGIEQLLRSAVTNLTARSQHRSLSRPLHMANAQLG